MVSIQALEWNLQVELIDDDASFSSSVDATSYIYASEIFPTPVRAKGLSVSISGLFIATILFLQAAPTAFDNVGWKYYLVFICVTSAIFVAMWLFFPEVRHYFLRLVQKHI